MYTIPSAHPVHFLMAVVAACAISVSLTSMAAITGLISDPTASVRRPAFLDTLAQHLPGATPVTAGAASPATLAAKPHDKPRAVAHRKHHAVTSPQQAPANR